MNDQPNLAILKAINEIQRSVSAIGIRKGRKNTDQGFMYRGIDDVYNIVGPVLAGNGVFILPHDIARMDQDWVTKNGGKGTHCTVTGSFRWQHISGEYLDVQCCGEGRDMQDKAYQKALSTAYKNQLFMVLCIPLDGTDADEDTGETDLDYKRLDELVEKHGLDKDEVARFCGADSYNSILAPQLATAIKDLTKRLEPTGTSVTRHLIADEKNLTPTGVINEHVVKLLAAFEVSPMAAYATLLEIGNQEVQTLVWERLTSQVRTAINTARKAPKVPTTQAFAYWSGRILGATTEDKVATTVDEMLDDATLTHAEQGDLAVLGNSRITEIS